MRFLHTADWHIGKRLHDFDLIEDQKAAYQQMIQIAEEEKVDAIVIAGDLYDRALASEESVQTLNGMLEDLNLKRHWPVLAISGNHDSAIRLETGTPWYQATHFYLHTKLAQAFDPVTIGDTQFFLLPYFEPVDARLYFDRDDIHTVQAAMEAIVAEMQTHFEAGKQHVLVAHFFAAGSSHSDSETKIEVGGLNAVPVDLMACFDYVALGHLHNRDALHEDRVRYSGSPLKFSVSEKDQTKGVWIVDTNPFAIHFRAITPIHDVVELTNNFKTLIDPAFYQDINRNDFIAVTLTDVDVIPNVMQELRQIYPHIIELHRQQALTVDAPTEGVQRRQLAPMTLLTDYFEAVTGHALDDQQQKWAEQSLQKLQHHDTEA
ncbi:exonuclease SbcCD subunit D [Lactobacillus selangorensis]|nr:exonuclease SbcCD subunit D [Lactobacillus selangorensis]